MFSLQTRRLAIRSCIGLGFVLTLVLAVYPDPALHLIGLNPRTVSNSNTVKGTDTSKYDEYATRLFPLLNAVFLTLLAYAASEEFRSERVSDSAWDMALPQRSIGAHETYRSIIVYTELPSFPDQAAVLSHLVSAVILANYKPEIVGSLAEVDKALARANIVGLVTDCAFLDDVLPLSTKAGKPLYATESNRSYQNTRLGSNRIRLCIGKDPELLQNIYATALPLARAYAPDVVRSVGFNGTWVTTYGLMSIKEDLNGTATGVYWYGYGEIEGRVHIDNQKSAVIMEFDWSQYRNRSSIGSRSKGRGVFVLAAGYEVFFGYWYIAGKPHSTQLWSGTRLSHDIVTDLLKTDTGFSRDFGLSQHSLSKIVDPGA